MRFPKSNPLLACALALASCATCATAQTQTRADLSSGKLKTLKGQIKGRGYADFIVKLGAGQSLSAALTSPSRSVYFNVLPPGSNGAALFNSSMTGQNKMAPRQMPMDGDTIVRVYQMGAAKDENHRAAFTITLGVSGKSIKAISSKQDAKLPGTPFHATAPVHCVIDLEPKRKTCDAYVIRRIGGAATVELRVGSMKRRVLFQRAGKPIAHDSSTSFTFSRSGDETRIRFGDRPDEEYTIPDVLITGG
ncbi:MAG: hypothetical protein K1X67_03880 [Fimbriimonadaceae bacterium]|nr:hypothetical protein [Fimbriimonadaceae bacterium]